MKANQFHLDKYKDWSPFKFLDAYEEKDKSYFYGRDYEKRQLLAAFKKSSLVILYGPSGSGKSSLINCGLIPNVRLNRSFFIRRNNNIIESIEQELFKDDNSGEIKFSDLIEQVDTIKNKINFYNQAISKINNNILDTKLDHQKGLIEKQEVTKIVSKLIAEKKETSNELQKAKKEEKVIKDQQIKITKHLLKTKLSGIT